MDKIYILIYSCFCLFMIKNHFEKDQTRLIKKVVIVSSSFLMTQTLSKKDVDKEVWDAFNRWMLDMLSQEKV